MKQSVKLLLLVVLYSAQLVKAQDSVTDVDDIADYPYAAFIDDQYSHYSGNGAIISNTHVITTASAISPAPSVMINVYVGNAVMHTGTRFKPKNIQKHPKYNFTPLEYNVAIITINGTFKGLPNVKPISIRTTAFRNPVNCFSVGWGVYSNFSITPMPRRVNYQLVTDQACAAKRGPQPTTIQCASALKGSGYFLIGGNPFVCGNQLYGIQRVMSTSYTYFTNDQPIDLFVKLTAASIQDFVFSIIPKPKHVDCH
uniref:Putative chymotrypsinogen a-like protein n=1 Tax=Anopheles darlingi TaxID=43151 RepID=A0A2M4CQ73_ANODA